MNQDDFLKIAKLDYKAYCAFSSHNYWIAAKTSCFLCDTVQKFIETKTGNAFDILCLSMPPQHGKSLTITETLPSWYLITRPRGRVIEISYNDTFAQKFGRRNKEKLEEFGKFFGVMLKKSPNSNDEFETTTGGSMISRGVAAGVTGNPCDLMIIDDPIKNRAEANSELIRSKLWDEWLDSYRSRLSAGAKVIVIQTRWHEDDLIGKLMENELHVKYLNLKCEADENDILGREPGDALMPEIGKDKAWIADFKQAYIKQEGMKSWGALFQGEPSFTDGTLLKTAWFKRYDPSELPEYERLIVSVDANFKEDKDSDFVAASVWAKKGPDIYMVEMVRKRMGFVDTVDEISLLLDRYPDYKALYIEEKANGAAIIDVLRRKFPKIIAIQPKGGKISRVEAVSPIIEAGNVWIPYGEQGELLLNECSKFPRGKHDDQVDSMSQALLREYHREVRSRVEVKPNISIFKHFGVSKPSDPLGRKIRYAAF